MVEADKPITINLVRERLLSGSKWLKLAASCYQSLLYFSFLENGCFTYLHIYLYFTFFISLSLSLFLMVFSGVIRSYFRVTTRGSEGVTLSEGETFLCVRVCACSLPRFVLPMIASPDVFVCLFFCNVHSFRPGIDNGAWPLNSEATAKLGHSLKRQQA